MSDFLIVIAALNGTLLYIISTMSFLEKNYERELYIYLKLTTNILRLANNYICKNKKCNHPVKKYVYSKEHEDCFVKISKESKETFQDHFFWFTMFLLFFTGTVLLVTLLLIYPPTSVLLKECCRQMPFKHIFFFVFSVLPSTIFMSIYIIAWIYRKLYGLKEFRKYKNLIVCNCIYRRAKKEYSEAKRNGFVVIEEASNFDF